MADFVAVTVNGEDMQVYLATPEPLETHPAVLVMHHRYGIDDFTKDICHRLAKLGFVGAAPDVFHRQPADTALEKRSSLLRDSEVVADIEATLGLLKGHSNVRADRLAILGHCMGGRMTFLGAAAFADFIAAVPYYSGNMTISWGDEGITPFDRLKDIPCPVLGFFGNDDENPTEADVDAISAELTRHGKAHEFHKYDGAGHAFQNFLSPDRYREEAAQDAWAKTEAFLAEHLH